MILFSNIFHSSIQGHVVPNHHVLSAIQMHLRYLLVVFTIFEERYIIKTGKNLLKLNNPKKSQQVLGCVTNIKRERKDADMTNENTKSGHVKTSDKNAKDARKITQEKLRAATRERKLSEIPIDKSSTMKINEFYGTEVVLDIDENEMREANNEFRFLRRGKNEEGSAEIVDVEQADGDKMLGGDVCASVMGNEPRAVENSIGPVVNDPPANHIFDHSAGPSIVLKQIPFEKKTGLHVNAPSQHSFAQKKTSKPNIPKKIRKKHDETLATTFKSFFSSFTPKKKSTKNARDGKKAVSGTTTKASESMTFMKSEMSLDELKMFQGRVKQLIEYFEKLKEGNNC
ncbi:hypothetical protein VCUG_02412 [Vavraia culicis subsp. floridensis]|uniref:Uncharacterized protein n=1 Tax=Vavraia culicis (isolate floridensis) TaxID=948595 RepID=L2GR55_VAVCU|nr:uncharacterized protein VCUG_02412 [Vavraia culicis subsp. floridensis]ELA46104.1 hypothetical protein VCUG_02412 [Vavraia culicis subsp. floridensis]